MFKIIFYCIMYSSFDKYIIIHVVDSKVYFSFCCLKHGIQIYHYVGVVSNVISCYKIFVNWGCTYSFEYLIFITEMLQLLL